MTTVAGTFQPNSNSATGTAISGTSIQCLSLDVVPLGTNNGNYTNIGGAANACLFPVSWSKPAQLPLVDLSKIFISTTTNGDGVAYIYTTQP